jgi:5,10-methylenetetrahydromethanopterin reductase
VELWAITRSLPHVALPSAQKAEQDGWTGLCFSDTQNRSADPYVAMSAVALSTSRLRLSTGVTNPATRHAAVTASAIASVQALSGGRAELGIGRGDSSLAHLGMAPTPVPIFEQYLSDVSLYLRGQSVPNRPSGHDTWASLAEGVALAKAPERNRIEWLEAAAVARVPVWAVASGPRVIQSAARVADQILLAVGANPDRIEWGIACARAVRPDIRIGAYVNLLVGDDRDELRMAAAGGVAGLARFGAMHGRAVGAMTKRETEVVESIPIRYDMTRHFQSNNRAAELPPDFVDDFAILGTPSEVIERIYQLAELGVERLHVVGPAGDIPAETVARLKSNLVEKVLPEVVSERL